MTHLTHRPFTQSACPAGDHARPSQQLFAVGEQKRSGLILCKRHMAEFAGPGAAICNPFNARYDQIIAIGFPEIVEVFHYEERQKAYGRRIQWMRWLQRITAEPKAHQRAEKIFAGFEEFFGNDVLKQLPDEVLALLAGVLPPTIARLRSQQQEIERSQTQHHASENPDLTIRVIRLGEAIAPFDPAPFSSLLNAHTHPAYSSLPCSA